VVGGLFECLLFASHSQADAATSMADKNKTKKGGPAQSAGPVAAAAAAAGADAADDGKSPEELAAFVRCAVDRAPSRCAAHVACAAR
jgi:hypothetical protein